MKENGSIILIIVMICAAVIVGFISHDRNEERRIKAGYVQKEYQQCSTALKWEKP